MNSVKKFFLVALFVTYVLLCATFSITRFPRVDEVAHFPAGISHWKFNRYDLYRVNPPLPRMIATLPSYLFGREVDWSLYSIDNRNRPEFSIGTSILKKSKTKIIFDLSIPRLLTLACALIGPLVLGLFIGSFTDWFVVCCLSALYLSCPNFLSIAGALLPEACMLSLTVVLLSLTHHWIYNKHIATTSLVGFSLGLLLLTKLTMLLYLTLFVLFIPVVFCLFLCRKIGLTNLRNSSQSVLLIVVIAVLVVNAGYGFCGSLFRLGDFGFVSNSLKGEGTPDRTGNRFAGRPLENLYCVFPKDYILGVDFLRMEVENKYWSFLDGKWRFGSWPYYYVLTTLYKTPEPTLIAAAMGVYIFLVSWWRGLMKPELVSMVLLLTIPAAVCFLSVSLQGGFNHHHRYVIMIYPPIFVFASLLASPMAEQVFSWKKLVAMVEDSHESEAANVSKALIPWWAVWRRYHWTKILAVVLVSLSVASTLRVHPYYTSYFNTLSGGPENGWRRLGFSNIDWGQDILEVDQWLKKYPERRPLVMDIDYFGMNGDLFDVPTSLPPQLPLGVSIDEVRRSITETQWWIISVKKLYNLPDQPGLQYLQQIEPVERIAYAYHVYRIDPLPPEESSSPDEPTP